MKQSFDIAAADYDRFFTHSAIGWKLRQIVLKYVQGVFDLNTSHTILELNCGTGEDAISFGQLGHRVIATDVSPEMIKITKSKVQQAGLEGRIEIQKMDMKEVMKNFPNAHFDVIFSNFGGMNCLNSDELFSLSSGLHKLLKPKGRLIAIIMGKFCLWESVYYTLKFQPSQIFRRNTSNPVSVDVQGENVETWYFRPDGFFGLFAEQFVKIKLAPLGVFLPPSYMETFFAKHKNLLSMLDKLELEVSNASILAYLSDHYIIDLQKK